MLGWRSGNDDFGGPDYCLGSAHHAWFLLCMNVSSLSNEPLCRYYGPCLTDEETRSEKYRNLTVITEKIRGLCTILELEASVYQSRLGNASWTWLPFILALNDGKYFQGDRGELGICEQGCLPLTALSAQILSCHVLVSSATVQSIIPSFFPWVSPFPTSSGIYLHIGLGLFHFKIKYDLRFKSGTYSMKCHAKD